MQGSVWWVWERGGEAMWEVDEGSVHKPRIGRGCSRESFWRRRCWSMPESEFLPKVSKARVDTGFVFSLRSRRHDTLTFGWPSPRSSSPKRQQLDYGEAPSPCFYCQYWRPNSGECSLSPIIILMESLATNSWYMHLSHEGTSWGLILF